MKFSQRELEEENEFPIACTRPQPQMRFIEKKKKSSP